MQDNDKLDLERITVMIVDDNAQSVDILAQVMTGFGARNIIRCSGAKEAKDILNGRRVDFILTDAEMPGEDGYELLRWLRRDAKEPNRFTPAILVTGHTRISQVKRARDCGAHLVVSKPIQANVLLERIFWVARDERMFVDCDAYAGPDRRFKFEGPPPGEDGRRNNDLPAEVGEATDANLSQDELDSMLKPSKVAL
ncbi:MAG: response regulator [Proteobacteria bacterium]|nr:response regulator [Pseudomonadota bacterium]